MGRLGVLSFKPLLRYYVVRYSNVRAASAVQYFPCTVSRSNNVGTTVGVAYRIFLAFGSSTHCSLFSQSSFSQSRDHALKPPQHAAAIDPLLTTTEQRDAPAPAPASASRSAVRPPVRYRSIVL